MKKKFLIYHCDGYIEFLEENKNTARLTNGKDEILAQIEDTGSGLNFTFDKKKLSLPYHEADYLLSLVEHLNILGKKQIFALKRK